MTGSLFVAAAAILWGLWPLWVRGAASGPATAAIALALAGLLALPSALAQRRRRTTPRSRTSWLLLIGLAAANALNCLLYFLALEREVAPAVLSHYLAPVLVALLAPALFAEPRSRRTPAALALAVAGTALLLFGGEAPAAGRADAVRGAVLLGGASALFFAAAVLLSKRLVRDFADAELFSFHALLGAAALACFGLPADPSAWLRPAAGGLLSTLLAGFLYYAGLRRIPVERVAVLTYLEIPAAAAVGWLAFGERLAAVSAVGGAAILIAGVLVATAPGRAG